MARKLRNNKQSSLFSGLEFALRDYQPDDQERLARIAVMHGLGRNSADLGEEELLGCFDAARAQEGHHLIVLVRKVVEGFVSYSPAGEVQVAAVSSHYYDQRAGLIARIEEQRGKYR